MTSSKSQLRFMRGFRPPVYAREGLTWGMRNPFDGPVFETVEEAEQWCIAVIDEHDYRCDSPADATIHPFKGLVECGRIDPQILAQVKATQRQQEEG